VVALLRTALRVALPAAAVLGVVTLGVIRLSSEYESPDGTADLAAALNHAARMMGLAPSAPPSYTIAHPAGERVELHATPGGDVIERLGARTEFGSPRTFFAPERRDDWLGVVVPELPNRRLGWIDLKSGQVEISETQRSLHVDLSRRSLEIRDGDDLVRRAEVSIGRAGHRTPAGRFAVTDALAGRGLGPWYGCCVLAISGHQPNLPPGWVGGDRIAIHGTPGPVGEAVSTGCVRTSDRDMVALFAIVPLGAPVFIRT